MPLKLIVDSLRKAAIFLTIFILVVGIIAGIAYYRITTSYYKSPYCYINIVELGNNSDLMQMYPQYNPEYIYECLWINGNVTNTGKETAYNVGLKVVAYTEDGTLKINMTVPFNGGVYELTMLPTFLL